MEVVSVLLRKVRNRVFASFFSELLREKSVGKTFKVTMLRYFPL